MNSPEDYYKRNIETIKRDSKKAKMSIGYVMQLCGIGYNQACETMEFGVANGCFEKIEVCAKREYKNLPHYYLFRIIADNPESKMLKIAMDHLATIEYLIDDWNYPVTMRESVTALLNEYYGEGIRPEEVGGAA